MQNNIEGTEKEGDIYFMRNSFRENIDILYKIDIDELVKLKDIINKLKDTVCRGEVNILDENDKLLLSP